MALTLSFGEIKIGMKFHFGNDDPAVNYIITKIWKNPRKILEMGDSRNHAIELEVDRTLINDPDVGRIIKNHLQAYSSTENHTSVDDFIKCGSWTHIKE